MANTDPFIGKYVLWGGPDGGGRQGQIMSRAADGYLVDVFSWLDGRKTHERYFSLGSLEGFEIYPDKDEFHLACQRQLKSDG